MLLPQLIFCLLLPQPPQTAETIADHLDQTPPTPYTALRHYTLTIPSLHKHATLTARIQNHRVPPKTIEILTSTGSPALTHHVLRRIAQSEAEATRDEAAITSRNYTFTLEGMETLERRHCYILVTTPKQKKKFLFRGKIWVDAEDFTIARIQGTPARNPSFWIRHTEFTQTFQRIGNHWLAHRNVAYTDARFVGATTLTIESTDYQLPPEPAEIAQQPH